MICSGRALLARPRAIAVVIDEITAIRPAPWRHVLARQNPDVLRHAKRPHVEIPVRAALHFLIQRREFPEIEGIVIGICVSQQRQQRMIEDFFKAFGAAGVGFQVGCET